MSSHRSDAIASAYAQPEALIKAIHGTGGLAGQGVSLLGELFADAQTASLSVTPHSNTISIQGEIHSSNDSAPLFGQEGAKQLGELPGGSWLAAGVGNVGANLPQALALLHGVASFGTSTVFSSLGGPSIEKLFSCDRLAKGQTATGLRRLGRLRRDVRERHRTVQSAGCACDLLEQPQLPRAPRSASWAAS